MRLLLISMLLSYHAFAPFYGGWPHFPGQECFSSYTWLARYLYSFFLEGFVFISGILAGYQLLKHPIKEMGLRYILKKGKRLILPSIVLSILYFILFYEWVDLRYFIIRIISGCGHMWFLPMLFWCFIGLWICEKINIHPYLVLVVAVLLCFATRNVPLQVGRAMYYFLFFYIGKLIGEGKCKKLLRPNFVVLSCLIILFLLTVPYLFENQYLAGGGDTMALLSAFVCVVWFILLLCYGTSFYAEKERIAQMDDNIFTVFFWNIFDARVHP